MAERREYRITEKAGKWLGNHKNTGVGSSIMLTEDEADYLLKLKQVVEVKTRQKKDNPGATVGKEAEKAEDEGEDDGKKKAGGASTKK